jgi:hypothetical protein
VACACASSNCSHSRCENSSRCLAITHGPIWDLWSFPSGKISFSPVLGARGETGAEVRIQRCAARCRCWFAPGCSHTSDDRVVPGAAGSKAADGLRVSSPAVLLLVFYRLPFVAILKTLSSLTEGAMPGQERGLDGKTEGTHSLPNPVQRASISPSNETGGNTSGEQSRWGFESVLYRGARR